MYLNVWIFLAIAILVFAGFAAGSYKPESDQTLPTRKNTKQVDAEIRRILNYNRFQSLKRKGRIK